jgi:hypothetical protein
MNQFSSSCFITFALNVFKVLFTDFCGRAKAHLFHVYEWEVKFQKHDFTDYVLTGGYNFARDLFSLLF